MSDILLDIFYQFLSTTTDLKERILKSKLKKNKPFLLLIGEVR